MAGGEILAAVSGARHEHVYLLRKAGRLVATGKTSAARYSVPPSRAGRRRQPTDGTPAVVWNGSNGGSLSSYQQKARG